MGWPFRKHECARDGHYFKPRYDEHPRDFGSGRMRTTGCWEPNEVRELMITRTYVRDVCRYCGATVERRP